MIDSNTGSNMAPLRRPISNRPLRTTKKYLKHSKEQKHVNTTVSTTKFLTIIRALELERKTRKQRNYNTVFESFYSQPKQITI